MSRFVLAFLVPALFVTAACSNDEPAAGRSTPATVLATVTPTPPSTPTATPGPQQILDGRVLDAFAAQYGPGREAMTLESLEEVEWPDGCLGIVRPSATCLAGPIPGYRATIGFERETLTWEIHTNESLDTVVWVASIEDEGTIESLGADTIVIAGESELFADTVSPGRIEVAVMPGTDFRAARESLKQGDRVAFGIAGRPSSDVAALVWIEAR